VRQVLGEFRFYVREYFGRTDGNAWREAGDGGTRPVL
jgi:hypothetical protein